MLINKNLAIMVLAVALVVCLIAFWIVPSIQKENAKKEADCLQRGVDNAIANIVGQLQSTGKVVVVLGNQTLTLVPYQNTQG
jgi:uncharacterized protein YacL